MLVLSRKHDEAIVIGDGIVVKIVEIRGDKVRLGIIAPDSVPVHRQEVYDAIKREAASNHTPNAPAPTGHIRRVMKRGGAK